MKILILGGSGEARQLAGRLAEAGHEVTTSLAGRTRAVAPIAGIIRSGGFGGAEGLAAYLNGTRFERLVDATHPFADEISAHAVAAATATGVALLRLERPPWLEPDGADWLHAADEGDAARQLPGGARVLLTVGRQEAEIFLARSDCRFVVRAIEAPQAPLPAHAKLLLARPPFSLRDEMALINQHRITHLVAKNAGGEQTAAKLEAAALTGARVVMIGRPLLPPARTVRSVEEALAALHEDAS